MKTIITFTFLLFSFLGFSQTTREEVMERNKLGQKVIVNTYTGTGNSEKLIKRTHYGDNDNTFIQLKPTLIQFFGSYKYEFSDPYSEDSTELRWGVIKKENYNNEGILISTWIISDENFSNSVGRVIKYTIIP
jgi:hypothetical protein